MSETYTTDSAEALAEACRALRHRGQVGYILGSGAFWMCDNCGTVIQ